MGKFAGAYQPLDKRVKGIVASRRFSHIVREKRPATLLLSCTRRWNTNRVAGWILCQPGPAPNKNRHRANRLWIGPDMSARPQVPGSGPGVRNLEQRPFPGTDLKIEWRAFTGTQSTSLSYSVRFWRRASPPCICGIGGGASCAGADRCDV